MIFFKKLYFIWGRYVSKNVETTALDRYYRKPVLSSVLILLIFQIISWSDPSLWDVISISSQMVVAFYDCFYFSLVKF